MDEKQESWKSLTTHFSILGMTIMWTGLVIIQFAQGTDINPIVWAIYAPLMSYIGIPIVYQKIKTTIKNIKH